MSEDIIIQKFTNKVAESLKGVAFINSYEFETFKTSIKPKFSSDIKLEKMTKDYFVFLLLKSISVSKEDKKDILFNKLEEFSDLKIRELIEIFEDEKRSFNLMVIDDINNINEIAKLKARANEDYFDIEKYNINNLI